MNASVEILSLTNDVWRVTGQILEMLSIPNENNPESQKILGEFNAEKVPGITVIDYIERLKKYSRCSNSSIVIALIYINRVLGKWPGTVLHKLNIHRLIISSLLVAIKVNEDQYYKTKFYSEIGGISSKELIKLEINLLKLLEFDVAVSLETFEDYYKCLIGEPQNGGLWFCPLRPQRGAPHWRRTKGWIEG